MVLEGLQSDLTLVSGFASAEVTSKRDGLAQVTAFDLAKGRKH